MKQSAVSTTKPAVPTSAFFGAVSYEVPATVLEFAERGAQQAKTAFDHLMAVAEDALSVVEDSYANLTKGFSELNLKAIDAAKANTNATFDLARSLTGVRSFAEAIEAQTAYVRGRFDAGVVQTQELTALASKVANDTAGPVREGFKRSLAQLQLA